MRFENRFSRLILCLATILIIALVQYTWSAEKKSSESVSIDNPAEAKGHKVIVYYFHGKNRCATCRKIEQLTREAVEEFFSSETNSGLIKLQVVNVDEAENRHFSKDYQLFTKSVVVSDMVNGKEKQWKNLQKIWELVHNEEAFKEYIRNEIKAYLS